MGEERLEGWDPELDLFWPGDEGRRVTRGLSAVGYFFVGLGGEMWDMFCWMASIYARAARDLCRRGREMRGR